ncbi:MAG: hypothetical protein QXJ64_06895 [Thermosphaera sp.]
MKINLLVMVLILCFALYGFLSSVAVSNALMLSWIIRAMLLLHFSLGFLGLMLILLQRSREATLLHYIVILMLAPLYVSGLFSKGIYLILFNNNDEYTVIPSMRSLAANIMLDRTGKLDVHLDPHYLYPLEYLAVYILKITSRISYLPSYVVIFGIFNLTLSSLIISLLINFLKRDINNSDIGQSLLAIGLLFHLLGSFYLGEYNTARSLFYLVTYVFLSLKPIRSPIKSSTSSTILLFILVTGTTLGSLRTSIMALLFLMLVSAYHFVKSKRMVVLFITMCIIPLVYMFYYGSLYVRGYVDYFTILTQALWNVIIHGFFEVKNPPLHTVTRAQHFNSYAITSFLGSLSFITLLIISYTIVLAKLFLKFIYLKRASSSRLRRSICEAVESYEIVFITAAFLSGALLGLAYLLNIFGYFVIDFESMIDLLLIMPMALMPTARKSVNFNQDNQMSKIFLTKATTPLLAVALIIVLAFSFFGLKLRYPIICMSEAVLVPGNPLLGTQHVSKAFEFVRARSILGLRVELSSHFSILYLTLPLKSLGISPVMVPASAAFSEAGTIYNNGLVYILSLPEGGVTFLDEIRLLPY